MSEKSSNDLESVTITEFPAQYFGTAEDKQLLPEVQTAPDMSLPAVKIAKSDDAIANSNNEVIAPVNQPSVTKSKSSARIVRIDPQVVCTPQAYTSAVQLNSLQMISSGYDAISTRYPKAEP